MRQRTYEMFVPVPRTWEEGVVRAVDAAVLGVGCMGIVFASTAGGLHRWDGADVVMIVLMVVWLITAMGVWARWPWARRGLIAAAIVTAAYQLGIWIKGWPSAQPPLFWAAFTVAWYYDLPLIKGLFTLSSMTSARVLVIDDDAGYRRTLSEMLRKGGFHVSTAQTGEEGLTKAREEKPDVVLLDVLLPRMKGRDVCRRLKQDPLTKNIPVLFLTAKDSDQDREAEREAGAAAHLTKPVGQTILLQTVRSVLHARNNQGTDRS